MTWENNIHYLYFTMNVASTLLQQLATISIGIKGKYLVKFCKKSTQLSQDFCELSILTHDDRKSQKRDYELKICFDFSCKVLMYVFFLESLYKCYFFSVIYGKDYIALIVYLNLNMSMNRVCEVIMIVFVRNLAYYCDFSCELLTRIIKNNMQCISNHSQGTIQYLQKWESTIKMVRK